MIFYQSDLVTYCVSCVLYANVASSHFSCRPGDSIAWGVLMLCVNVGNFLASKSSDKRWATLVPRWLLRVRVRMRSVFVEYRVWNVNVKGIYFYVCPELVLSI